MLDIVRVIGISRFQYFVPPLVKNDQYLTFVDQYCTVREKRTINHDIDILSHLRLKLVIS